MQIQYDQSTGRRMLNAAPEQATSENSLYLDCSSYVNSIYYYSFGIHITPTTTSSSTNTNHFMLFAKNNQFTNSEVIEYVETSQITNPIDQSNKLNQIWNDLQIGDVIVYRYDNNTAGHVMIYMGNDVFLHATGSSYDYVNKIEKYETNGAVQELSASDVFSNTSSSRYLFKDAIDQFCVLRPLNRGNITPTFYARNVHRLAELNIENHASIANFSHVVLGDTISYYITLKNMGDSPIQNFLVTAQLSEFVEIDTIFQGGTYDNHQIQYLISHLEGGATLQLEYRVSVKNETANIGEMVESNDTTIYAIKANDLYHLIVGVNQDEQLSLVSIMNDYINTTQDNLFSLIQNIFHSFTNLIDKSNPISDMESLDDIYQSDFAASYLYGGSQFDSSSTYNQDNRVRLLKIEYFAIGDILMSYDDSYHIYIFDGTYFISLDEASKVIHTTNYSSINAIITSMNGYSSYKVIRPLSKII